MTTHELEEDFSAQLSRGDSRWWCTCEKWSTPIWHTPLRFGSTRCMCGKSRGSSEAVH